LLQRVTPIPSDPFLSYIIWLKLHRDSVTRTNAFLDRSQSAK